MPRDWRLRIHDIIHAIEKAQRHTKGMDISAFMDDEKAIDAVIRVLAVIGEAAKHTPREIKRRHHAIPWQDMQDLRNFVIHEYFEVDLETIWNTVKFNLPPLIQPLRRVLEEAQEVESDG